MPSKHAVDGEDASAAFSKRGVGAPGEELALRVAEPESYSDFAQQKVPQLQGKSVTSGSMLWPQRCGWTKQARLVRAETACARRNRGTRRTACLWFLCAGQQEAREPTGRMRTSTKDRT
eukprot:1159855-Rhodomonas_salina.2